MTFQKPLERTALGILVLLAAPAWPVDPAPPRASFSHRVIDPAAGTNGVDINLVGDVNGDGLDDVIVAAKGGEVIWYENPSLTRRQIYKASFKWSCEGEMADIDGDKDNDIVLVSWYESRHYWLENPGPGGGEWKLHEIGGGIRGHDVEAADLDGDGLPEVIVRSETWPRAQASAKQIQIWKRQSVGAWRLREILTTEGGGIKAADVDRDRDMDIIAGGRWYENDGRGVADGAWKEHIIDAECTTYNKIEFADINGDGRKDIIITPSETHAAFKETGPVVWYEHPAGGALQPWRKHIAGKSMGDLHSLSIDDVNLDGKADIFTAQMHNSEGPNHEVIVYLNHGGGDGWTKQILANTGSHQAFLFDLSGDGDADVVGINYNTNTLELWENTLQAPGAREFVFFDEVIVQTGKKRLWDTWDFVTRLPVKPGAPKNWVTPVDYANGTLRFRIEVLEMGPIDSPVSMHMGWENIEDDPEIRHTAGAPVLFSKPGIYETTVPIKDIKIWYGKGPKKDQRCHEWDWRHAWTPNKIYTFIQPRKNPPGKDGFPYKVRATITIAARQ